jgi:hypothetical protein
VDVEQARVAGGTIGLRRATASLRAGRWEDIAQRRRHGVLLSLACVEAGEDEQFHWFLRSCFGMDIPDGTYVPPSSCIRAHRLSICRACGCRERESRVDITGIETYAAYMNEIKERISVMDRFLTGQRDAGFVQTTAETMGLQFRKVLELIAFASLAANRDQYSFAYSDFATHWAAAKLLKNLKRINPTYYPKPVVPAPTTHPKAPRSL